MNLILVFVFWSGKSKVLNLNKRGELSVQKERGMVRNKNRKIFCGFHFGNQFGINEIIIYPREGLMRW